MSSRAKFIGRSLFVFFWLLLISIPTLTLVLAASKEIKIGGEQTYLRIFLLQEKDAEGIGLEISQFFSKVPFCSQTDVRYFMWTGEPDNVKYCHCLEPQTGYSLQFIPGACAPP